MGALFFPGDASSRYYVIVLLSRVRKDGRGVSTRGIFLMPCTLVPSIGAGSCRYAAARTQGAGRYVVSRGSN